MGSDKAVLLLEDGTVFDGLAFAEAGEALGEAVLYTGVVGYQEVATDPSYRGALVTMTYPIIGSYGVNAEDNESPAVQARGVVIRDYSACVSNFRATGAFEDFLKQGRVVGIRAVDTRAVAVHLREHGEMRAAIAPADADRTALLAKLKATPSAFASDLVRELPAEASPAPPAEPRHRVAVLNLGVKRSLLAQLAQLGCAVEILPAATPADDVAATGAASVILAGGPGDPRVPAYAIETARALVGKLPVLGIGLGHQVLALALGCPVRRMKLGHHGVNYPVRGLADRHCDITVQHHSFVVDEAAVPDAVEVTHVNVNDQTIEGIRSKAAPAAGVQFHPTPDEMGRPSRILERFVAQGD
ncbi:MAG TPA: glutamine-hydrolyzing carbamoyl-phosphate synthase small subunit [Planctomycetota bacterium]|nr:glutamine-hydrolyzing carbamoyl-phosphate synthase small subunit [Planctomycetota bacterium]